MASQTQPSAASAAMEAVNRDTVLILAPGLRHDSEGCGERVDCPLGCEVGGGYHPAERLSRRGGTFLYCNRCRTGWRELAA